LRTRDLPALEFFKQKLEIELGMKTETGVLSFSLIKYGIMPHRDPHPGWILRGRPRVVGAFFEAAIASWLCMLVAACIVPYLLYRDTSGEWLAPMARCSRHWRCCPAGCVRLGIPRIHDNQPGMSNRATTSQASTSAENIEALISAGAEEGLIEEEDRKLIQSVVEFGDTLCAR
jgi:CBS domain containing-hemolysin-like protein